MIDHEERMVCIRMASLDIHVRRTALQILSLCMLVLYLRILVVLFDKTEFLCIFMEITQLEIVMYKCMYLGMVQNLQSKKMLMVVDMVEERRMACLFDYR